MSTPIVCPIAEPGASLAVAGGKGASLARLALAGLPVPDGYVITTAAYDRFVNGNSLLPRIMNILEAVSTDQPETLEAASAAIGELFAQAETPSDVIEAVRQAYARLSKVDPAVAVRSSATAEDLPDFSFAGQQETYLNVRGEVALLAAIKRCWASLWTARAIGYRIRNGIDQETVSLAVIVQLMVDAEAAGILFTANPITGRREEVLISASWGLGEAVVGGLVTPDTIIVEKVTKQILSYEIADKVVMTVPTEEGTHEQPISDRLRRKAVLTDREAADLTKLGLEIEALYGQPMDVEWTLHDGQIDIVQARPITALPDAAPSPVEWALPKPKGYYMRASVVELMPDPLTPLFETLGLRGLNGGLRRLVAWMAKKDRELSGYAMHTINGYAYLDASLSAGDWWFMLTRLVPRFPRVLRQGKVYWRETACVNYAETTAQWASRSFEDLLATELLAGVREIFDKAADHLGAVMTFLGACAGSEGLLTRIYDRMVKQEGDPPAPALVMGFDSMPVLGEKALFELAQWCRTKPALAHYVINTAGQEIARMLHSGEVPDEVSREIWEDWQGRFRSYLEAYGYSIYDLDFGKPLPLDDPVTFLENCRMFIRGDGKNPHERQQAYADRREATVNKALSRLRGLKLKLFKMALGWAQGLAPLREDGIANVGYGYPVLRAMLFELGRRLEERGVLEAKEDIFWIKEDELERAVTSLDANLPIDNFTAQVAERKETWKSHKALTPPPQLPARDKYMGMDVNLFLAHGEQEGDVIKGVPSSPGQITAPARVLHGPEDFSEMRPGDVLVASITTPAWTPLFSMASAVVTDIGGPLSHSSIVAREYGIPAVLGTGFATRRIRSGQIITVDGSSGQVLLAHNGDKA